jgi:predicted ABC-type transport system involved in lysophospholipase L1 biosynthesis ATPase subunit
LIIFGRILKGNMMEESKFSFSPLFVLQGLGADRSRTIRAGERQLAIVSNPSMYIAEIEAYAGLLGDSLKLLEALRTLHDFALPLRGRGLAAESEQAFADARALLEKHGG